MTQEWMFKTLIDLGFKQKDAEVYVFLALNGPQGVKEIADSTKTYKRKVYRILKKLQSNEIVRTTFDLPTKFSVVAFNKLLDLLISDNEEEANRIEEKKDEILTLWRSNFKGLKTHS
jgi:sugar-specific transcriptional regulator TrmB